MEQLRNMWGVAGTLERLLLVMLPLCTIWNTWYGTWTDLTVATVVGTRLIWDLDRRYDAQEDEGNG